METVGLGFHFEDLPVGRRFRTIGRTVTEADITNFVNCTGMVEVLFTNTEFLREESDIKQRLAPAALSYCFAEGLLVQATMQHTGFAFLHMEFNVEKPVFAGDTIHVECEVIEARLSRNRPGRGLVRTRNQVMKQDGTVALTYTPLRMIKCRRLIPTVVACLRTMVDGTARREVRTFKTTTKALLELSEWLASEGCTHIAMEATGVYWKPVWHILGDGEFELMLVNAAHVKNVPGRKTDVSDATWLADLLAHGLIRGSFVPDAQTQEMRGLLRTRKQLVRERTSHIQRLQKTLEDANIKLD